MTVDLKPHGSRQTVPNAFVDDTTAAVDADDDTTETGGADEAACRISALMWQTGTETDGTDLPNVNNTRGYSPTGSEYCGRAACRISTLKGTMGKETGARCGRSTYRTPTLKRKMTPDQQGQPTCYTIPGYQDGQADDDTTEADSGEDKQADDDTTDADSADDG